MAKKKEKATIENKAVKPKSKAIEWDTMPNNVIIVGKKSKHLQEGKEYDVTKETAQLLINKGWAKLK